jgi:hypothetical protein
MFTPQISSHNIHNIQLTQLPKQGRIFGSVIGHWTTFNVTASKSILAIADKIAADKQRGDDETGHAETSAFVFKH